MKLMDEFKEFISKGDAMSMAVGVVVGGAFTAIVNSLVGDIITPVIALITKLFQNAAGDEANKLLDMKNWVIPSTEIKIGAFIQSILSFLIIAFIVFCMVKAFNTVKEKVEKKKEAEEAAAAVTQEQLLTEIRDLLKEKIE